MGNAQGKPGASPDGVGVGIRSKAITGGAVKGKATLPKLPANAVKCQAEDYTFIEVRRGAAAAACGRRKRSAAAAANTGGGGGACVRL